MFKVLIVFILLVAPTVHSQDPTLGEDTVKSAARAEDTERMKRFFATLSFPAAFDGDDRCNRMIISSIISPSGTRVYQFKPYTQIPLKAELYKIIAVTDQMLYLEREVERSGGLEILKFRIKKDERGAFNNFKIEYTENGNLELGLEPYEATIECFTPLRPSAPADDSIESGRASDRDPAD